MNRLTARIAKLSHNKRGPWWLCPPCHVIRETAQRPRLILGHWREAAVPPPVVVVITPNLTSYRDAMRHFGLDAALSAARLSYSFARNAADRIPGPLDEPTNARLTDARDRYYTARDLHDADKEAHGA